MRMLLNNPINYRDPSGHSPRSCALGFCSTVVNTAAVYAAPSGVPGAALKVGGITLSFLSMGNAYYENKVTHTMSDFDYKATLGLEALNLVSAGSAAAAARIGRNIEAVVETAEVADRSITAMTRAAGVPLFTKDVLETYGEHASSTAISNALDHPFWGLVKLTAACLISYRSNLLCQDCLRCQPIMQIFLISALPFKTTSKTIQLLLTTQQALPV